VASSVMFKGAICGRPNQFMRVSSHFAASKGS
jgi:hypothetical protein